MRLLMWGSAFPSIGGVERFLDTFCPELASRGHTVAIISNGAEVRRFDKGPINISMYPFQKLLEDGDPAGLIEAIAGAKKIAAAFEPDLIHYHAPSPSVFFLERALASVKAPLVMTAHAMIPFGRLAENISSFDRIVGRSSRLVTASEFMASEFLASAATPLNPLSTIPYGLPVVDTMGPPPGQKRLLGIGRLVEEKGLDLLVSAMPAILKSHPDATATIAGEGPALPRIRDLATRLKVDHAIDWPGWVGPEDVHQQMAASDIVVMPSRWEEPFGLIALEAAQAGRPCIAARIGGLPEVVSHGETGLTVTPDDPTALADAVIALLDDRAMAVNLGEVGHAQAKTKFNISTMTSAYEQLYEEVLQQA